MIVDSLEHFKSVFAHNLFIRPADYNYTISRWSFFNGYYREFYWQGLQAIEKYSKASLVLNGVPVRRYSHEIVDLFAALEPIAGQLFPEIIVAPNQIQVLGFRASSRVDFISRVYRFGHPDTRYNHLSYDAAWSDLVKMDWICYNLRRVTVNLNGVAGADFPVTYAEEVPGLTYRQIIAAHPNFHIRCEINLPPQRTDQARAELRSLIHRFNFAYLRLPADLERGPDRAILEKSYLFLLSEALQAPNRAQFLTEGTRWLVESMRLSQEGRAHFQRLIGQGN